MKNIGSKIVVVGVSASGKTTFSKKLAEKTNIPLVLMDEIMWNPGWDYIGDDKTLEQLLELAQKDTWIIEGYITKKARTILFEKADTIIYLDYNPFLLVWRYVKRFLQHRKTPRAELPGSPEKFSWKFLKLVFTKGEAISLNKFLSEVNENKIIKFSSPKQSVEFLDKVSS